MTGSMPRSVRVVATLLLGLAQACGGGGGGGSAGPAPAPLYLSGDVRWVDVDPEGFVSVNGRGGQLELLRLGQIFSSAELELGFQAGKIPPLPPPFSFDIDSRRGEVFVAVDPGVRYRLDYLAPSEAVVITTSAGVHLLVDGADIIDGPSPEADGVRFKTSRRGGADRLFDSIAFSDGQDSARYVAITDLGIDGDGDLVAEGLDCNDADPAVSPRELEIALDGIDQNCDGLDIPDDDQDGFASDAFAGGDDCDDMDFFVNPGVEEIIGDAIDNDCDGQRVFDDDGDGAVRYVGGPDPSPDCDDDDPNTFPGAREIVGNGKDNNCNGIVPPNRIVAFGDSITLGIGDNPDRELRGYPPRLARRLGLPDNRVINRGRGEEDAFEAGERIRGVLRDDEPDLVILLYGANDSLRQHSATGFISDVEFLVNEALNLGVEPVIVQTTEVCCGRAQVVFPTLGGYPGGEPAWNRLIREYQVELENLASRLGLVYVHLNDEFRAQDGGLPAMLADGLHPNEVGYDVVADLLTETLEGPDF